MHSTSRRSSIRHGIAWLLWLALLVPLAQSTALVHGFSHVRSESGDHRQSDQAPKANHCDLCLASAALAGGALPAHEAKQCDESGHDSVDPAGATSVCQRFPNLGYWGRAPPFSLH
ncbi:MAG: hypothetical protein ABI564_12715 [Ideonella sp.]